MVRTVLQPFAIRFITLHHTSLSECSIEAVGVSSFSDGPFAHRRTESLGIFIAETQVRAC